MLLAVCSFLEPVFGCMLVAGSERNITRSSWQGQLSRATRSGKGAPSLSCKRLASREDLREVPKLSSFAGCGQARLAESPHLLIVSLSGPDTTCWIGTNAATLSGKWRVCEVQKGVQR